MTRPVSVYLAGLVGTPARTTRGPLYVNGVTLSQAYQKPEYRDLPKIVQHEAFEALLNFGGEDVEFTELEAKAIFDTGVSYTLAIGGAQKLKTESLRHWGEKFTKMTLLQESVFSSRNFLTLSWAELEEAAFTFGCRHLVISSFMEIYGLATSVYPFRRVFDTDDNTINLQNRIRLLSQSMSFYTMVGLLKAKGMMEVGMPMRDKIFTAKNGLLELSLVEHLKPPSWSHQDFANDRDVQNWS